MTQIEENRRLDNTTQKNRITKTHFIQFLPEQLLQESQTNSIVYNNQKLKTPYLIDIIHTLILKYYFKKENIFHLSSIVLKEKYGHKYNYYIGYLCQTGILKLIKNHQKGKNARIYKLDTSVLNGKITRYKNIDRVLLKKYKNITSVAEIEKSGINIIDTNIKKKLINDLFNTKIEYEKAMFFLDSTLQDIDIYNRNKYSIECINDNHIFYHFDDYGRFHTNFTILKSFIRKNCLLIDGEETYEKDIPNCQPRLLSRVIEQSDNKLMINDIEFTLYKYLTNNGLFYQYIIDNSDIKVVKDVKKLVYKVFFGKNYKNKMDLIFKSLFPTIHVFISSYKKEMGSYKSLSHRLQKDESNLIFNRIIKCLIEIVPEIRIVTVHDSIIVPIKYKEILDIVFNEKLIEEFGSNN